MFLEQPALGAAALVGARKQVGITQEQLAERTGLSVRTIRSLETGGVRRPRRSTLEQLTNALDLLSDDARWFVTSWTAQHSPVSIFELLARGYDLDTLLALRTADGFRDVATWAQVIIGPDRVCTSIRTSIVMEAEHDGLAHRLLFWGGDAGTEFDQSAVQLRDVRGCREHRRVLGTQRTFAAFELLLPRPMRVGETHLLSYEMALDESRRAPVVTPTKTGSALRGFHRPAAILAIDVQFEGCGVPARVSQVRRDDTPADVRVRDLPVVDGRVQLVVRNADAGVHGITWSW